MRDTGTRNKLLTLSNSLSGYYPVDCFITQNQVFHATTGLPTAKTGYQSLKVACNPGDKMSASGVTLSGDAQISFIVFYNAQGLFLSNLEAYQAKTYSDYQFTVPVGAYFLAINSTVGNIINLKKYQYKSFAIENTSGGYVQPPYQVTSGYLLTSGSGTAVANAAYQYAKIPCYPGDKFRLSGSISSTTTAFIVFYKQDGSFLSCPQAGQTGITSSFVDYEVVVPNNAAFMGLVGQLTQPFMIRKFAPLSNLVSYWFGKRVLWLGTSIPEGNQQPAYGYPDILGSKLGAIVTNQALGSSGVRSGIASLSDGLTGAAWSITRNLTQTKAQKQDFVTNWATWQTKFTGSPPATLSTAQQNLILTSSYEDKLDPYLTDANKQDLYVIDHGWNDNDADLSNTLYNDWTNIRNDGTDTNRYNTQTFRGAMNWIIRRILQAQPDANILIVGSIEGIMHHVLLDAQQQIAYENSLQFLPLYPYLGLSNKTITSPEYVDSNGNWVVGAKTDTVNDVRIYDGTHPHGWLTNRIADALACQFNYNIR